MKITHVPTLIGRGLTVEAADLAARRLRATYVPWPIEMGDRLDVEVLTG